MPRGIHSLMQYANHINRTAVLDKENEMAPHCISTIPLANFITTASAPWIARNTFD